MDRGHARSRPWVRREERIPVELWARYGPASLDRRDHVADLSQSGLCIQTNEGYPPGTPIQIMLEVGGERVYRRGLVVWSIRVPEAERESMHYGMGVQFVDDLPGWSDLLSRIRAGLGRGGA